MPACVIMLFSLYPSLLRFSTDFKLINIMLPTYCSHKIINSQCYLRYELELEVKPSSTEFVCGAVATQQG